MVPGTQDRIHLAEDLLGGGGRRSLPSVSCHRRRRGDRHRARPSRQSGRMWSTRGSTWPASFWHLGSSSKDGIVGVVRVVLVNDRLGDSTTPLVVLIDADSASAAEMVASALQDAGRATLMGQTTFGTGTGLAEYLLDDGSLLSIGIVEWLTRAGRSVWHTGVKPDIALALPNGAMPITPIELTAYAAGALRSSGDTQLLKAMELLNAAGR